MVGAARPVPVTGHEVIEPGGAEPKEGCESTLLVRLLHPHRVKYLLPVYVACVLVVMVMRHLPWVVWDLVDNVTALKLVVQKEIFENNLPE